MTASSVTTQTEPCTYTQAGDVRRFAIKAWLNPGMYLEVSNQGASDHPNLADRPLERDITSVSLGPDTAISTWIRLARWPAAQTTAPANPSRLP